MREKESGTHRSPIRYVRKIQRVRYVRRTLPRDTAGSSAEPCRVNQTIPVVGGEDSRELSDALSNLPGKALRQLYWLMRDGPHVAAVLEREVETGDQKRRRWGRAELGEMMRQEFHRRRQRPKEQKIQPAQQNKIEGS